MRRLGLILAVGTVVVGCKADKSAPRLGPGQENSSTLGTDWTQVPRGLMIPPVYPGNDLSERGSATKALSDNAIVPSSLVPR